MSVKLVEMKDLFGTHRPVDFHNQLRTAIQEVNWAATDLVIANTMVSFWAIHAAQSASIPSLLYVHESSSVRNFFKPMLAPALFPVVEEAFALATRVVFTADSSRQVFDSLNTHRNFARLPSWVDIERITVFAANHDRNQLRKKHALDSNAILIVNIGSICERKGQHIFIRAIELLSQELRLTYPGQKIEFVMVGARPGYYLESLKQDVRLHQLDNVRFLPESGEIYDFYQLADILVCTSFEESFPRVLLESAAFGLPIVTTNVNGIAEMLAHDEAWIIPPGDRYQLGEAIKQALAAHFAADRRRAEKAKDSITRCYNQTRSMPQHVALARAAIADKRN